MCRQSRCLVVILDFTKVVGDSCERECVALSLFFGDLQLHETRADLSHKREQVVVTRRWGLESHTHMLRLPGTGDLRQ